LHPTKDVKGLVCPC